MVTFKIKRALKRGSLAILSILTMTILFYEYSQNKSTALHYLDKNGISQTLTLSVIERDRLAWFLEEQFIFDSFVYVILGNKPLSWGCYQDPLPFSNWTNFFSAFSEYNRNMRSGWETWEKYQYLFPLAHIWSETSERHPGAVSIIFVNDERFNDVVNQNKRDFQEVLGREIVDGFQLLREAKSCSLMHDVLQGHQALLGIVLGYGRDNAWKFSEGCKVRQPIGWVWGSEEEYFGENNVPQDTDIWSTYCDLSHYSCPSFAGDPNSDESRALKADYLMTKQKVLDYYKDKDFLEATLSLLAGYNPSL